MGASEFSCVGHGKSAKEAFMAARAEAQYESGHGGYTGTIAEKRDFVMVPVPAGVDPFVHANALIAADDSQISDKWGPAGCISLGDNKYLFFGFASS